MYCVSVILTVFDLVADAVDCCVPVIMTVFDLVDVAVDCVVCPIY